MFRLPNSLFPRARARNSREEQCTLLRELRGSVPLRPPVDLGLGGDGELRSLSGRLLEVGERRVGADGGVAGATPFLIEGITDTLENLRKRGGAGSRTGVGVAAAVVLSGR
jgi:hypothetical protein